MANPRRILIVEDDAASRLLAAAILEEQGFVVDAAGSAEEAVELIKRSAPDLILMDIRLPGMDGLQLTRILKADPSTAAIPVIALTAHMMPLHQRAAIAAGCSAFITKPVSPATLAAEVRSHIT
ncbi:MAG: response regulator [Candidatus Dormiibacterota bacterium]